MPANGAAQPGEGATGQDGASHHRPDCDQPSEDAPDQVSRAASTSGSPIVDGRAFWRDVGSAAVIGIFVILAGTIAFVARPILLPIVAAVIVGGTIGPLADRASRHGRAASPGLGGDRRPPGPGALCARHRHAGALVELDRARA